MAGRRINPSQSSHDRSGGPPILAVVEAALKMDYLTRVYERRKDDLSRVFRDLYREKGRNARLDDDTAIESVP